MRPLPEPGLVHPVERGPTVNFPPRHLHVFEGRNREQQTGPDWLRAYGVRSDGVASCWQWPRALVTLWSW